MQFTTAAAQLGSDDLPVERLRIALLGYRSNPFSGGQGVYLKYLSKALVDAGHEVDVISGAPYPELDARVRLIPLPGLNLFEAPNHLTALRPANLKSATDTLEWLLMVTGGFPEPYTFGRRLQKHRADLRQYDVIHDNQSLSWGVLQLAELGLPLTTTIHHPITWDRDIALDHARTRVERWGIRRWHYFLRMQGQVAKRMPHIVTVSERARQDIAQAFGIASSRIDVVHNGVDTDEFRPMPRVARKPLQIISTASADQPLKGTQHLVPAFAQVVRELPDAKLVFIGRPKPGGATAKLIETQQLQDHIEVHTGISNDELVALYAASSIAVVPSEYEGFGLPAVEAMACGVPVVSSDGGALPEVVGDAGVVVPSKNSAALGKALLDLLKDPQRQRQLAAAGRQRVEQQFSWASTAQNMIRHYAKVRRGS